MKEVRLHLLIPARESILTGEKKAYSKGKIDQWLDLFGK
jgi:hypothetical protein